METKFYVVAYFKSQTKTEQKKGIAKTGKFHILAYSRKFDVIKVHFDRINESSNPNHWLIEAKSAKDAKQIAKDNFNNKRAILLKVKESA